MSSEKTEQPTEARLREARARGQLARSRLLGAAAVTLGGMAGLGLTLDSTGRELTGFTAKQLCATAVNPKDALFAGLVVLAKAVAPVVACAMIAGLAVATATAGLQFHPKQLAPSWERVSPAAGLARLFSVRALLELGKGLFVAAVVVWFGWHSLAELSPDSWRGVWLDGGAGLSTLLRRLGPVLFQGALLMLALGGFDQRLARWQHLRSLRMTRDEIRREHKQQDGDPHHKAKRQSLHRQLASGGPARGVQRASVVVVNPTHIAVALRYQPDEAEAPYLVAKGREADALALKATAWSLGIPVVKDVPLARSLVHLDVGEAIPEELYQAAAAILRLALDTESHHPLLAKEAP